MGRIARQVRVTGGVQGVFYRAWTRQQADELGVAGWVRNCADGSVEAEIEGGEEKVAELLERMASGPPAARVSDLIVSEAELSGTTGFTIRH